ncbi:MAG TPA: glucodextranase DOMON-like domain-containing protein [Anaerolineae bacterium]|nr:glucodextranase DOMON-like domain-containing protein [Anaerolineae bacterium]
MNRTFENLVSLLALLAVIAAACTPPTETPAPPITPAEPTDTPVPVEPEEPPLYVALVWHQHQPLYYKDPETNVYTRPWVRVHATKDYYDMAAILKSYPDVHVTFNLTPVLIRQLDDLAAGAKDIYWVLAEKPADQLTEDEKRFILQRFFDVNPKIVNRFPRYTELQAKRGGAEPEQIDAALESYTEQDFRDLQVLFNLAWFDPDFLTEEPLKSLVEKGESFAESDKPILFDKATEVIQSVIPVHKELQDAGQIEVITTPYAHPILPLIYSTRLALVGSPEGEKPTDTFSYPNDAKAHVEKSVEIYEQHYGQKPRGMWPGEGAVAEDIVKMVGEAGYNWMASGEQVLARSIGIDSFTRDSADTVQEADALYRPYLVEDAKSGAKVNMIFRDLRLSDLIGFEYSNKDGEAAAEDLMQRLENIRQQLKKEGAEGPHLVSIILDGENAWEHYPNDGKAFFHALYEKLSSTPAIKTVTPSEFFAMVPTERAIESLYPGAWFSPNYDTWIGESEEAKAWDYLRRTRQTLAQYDILQRRTTSPENLARALDFMYLAEGSDWFWWYGADQDSGNDDYFDFSFRSLLSEVYIALGELVPDFVQAPIVSRRAAQPTQPFKGLFTPIIDGAAAEGEWDNAGTYLVSGGAQARSEDVIAALRYGMDQNNLYARIDARDSWGDIPEGAVNLYLSMPRAEGSSPFSIRSAVAEDKTALGFQATHALDVSLDSGAATPYRANTIGEWIAGGAEGIQVAVDGSVLEAAIPLALLGDDVQTGDDLRFAAIASSGLRDLHLVPTAGPAQVVIPDLGTTTVVLSVADPEGDDHGPGTYTYPTDGVFKPGVFDIKEFTAGYDENNIVFKFTFYGPIPNPWGSPNNLAVQTLDVYVDKDPGTGTGARLLLPGRNAALEPGNGWEVAIWAEGWTPQIHAPDAEGKPKQMSADFKVLVDPAAQTATLRVPRSVFGDDFDPARAAYLGIVASQDGFPSKGVWRLRDVFQTAEQWKLGGGPDDANHTRIIDAAIPAGAPKSQEESLSAYPPSQETNLDLLAPDDFPQLPALPASLGS